MRAVATKRYSGGGRRVSRLASRGIVLDGRGRPSLLAPSGLLYRVLCRIALARVHHDFYVLALLVANLQ